MKTPSGDLSVDVQWSLANTADTYFYAILIALYGRKAVTKEVQRIAGGGST